MRSSQMAAAVFRVERDSNRVGVRLRAESGAVARWLPARAGELDSQGVVTGAVQVPPGGNPVVLLPDHATLGGYPVVGVVATADHGLLGQCAPGTRVRLVPIELGEARRAAARGGARPVRRRRRALPARRRLTRGGRRAQTSSFTAVPTPMTTTTARSAGAGSDRASRAPA